MCLFVTAIMRSMQDNWLIFAVFGFHSYNQKNDNEIVEEEEQCWIFISHKKRSIGDIKYSSC